MLANLIQVVLDKSLVMWLSNSVELINNECRDFKIPERDARNRQGKGSLVMYLTEESGRWSGARWLEHKWLFYELLLPLAQSMSVGIMLLFRWLSFLCFGTAIVGSFTMASSTMWTSQVGSCHSAIDPKDDGVSSLGIGCSSTQSGVDRP